MDTRPPLPPVRAPHDLLRRPTQQQPASFRTRKAASLHARVGL